MIDCKYRREMTCPTYLKRYGHEMNKCDPETCPDRVDPDRPPIRGELECLTLKTKSQEEIPEWLLKVRQL